MRSIDCYRNDTHMYFVIDDTVKYIFSWEGLNKGKEVLYQLLEGGRFFEGCDPLPDGSIRVKELSVSEDKMVLMRL
jgi:hypothetical protein